MVKRYIFETIINGHPSTVHIFDESLEAARRQFVESFDREDYRLLDISEL